MTECGYNCSRIPFFFSRWLCIYVDAAIHNGGVSPQVKERDEFSKAHGYNVLWPRSAVEV